MVIELWLRGRLSSPVTEPSPSVSEKQLRLFPMHSPLAERFGPAFFRAIPHQPGIYRMHDQAGRLIYVGKARDLRQRLNSYRYPARASRKTVRLLHAVRAIHWEVCATELQARLRENEMLRTHRPRFNRVGTWPWACRFVGLVQGNTGFRLCILAEPKLPEMVLTEPELFGSSSSGDGSAPVEIFGAFKGGVIQALGALLRLFWVAFHPGSNLAEAPGRLLQVRAPRSHGFDGSSATDWVPPTRAYLSGRSMELLDALESRVAPPASTAAPSLADDGNRFHALQMAADLALAREFYERGPRRNAGLHRLRARADSLVLPEELDDLLLLANGRATEERAATAP